MVAGAGSEGIERPVFPTANSFAPGVDPSRSTHARASGRSMQMRPRASDALR